MKTERPKILFIPSSGPDYLEDIVYHGLIKILGRERVVDYPRKEIYHCKPGTKINVPEAVHHSQFLNPNKFPMLLFEDVNLNYPVEEIHFEDFDYAIIGSLRHDVIKKVCKVLNKIEKEKIIFLDGEDDPFIRSIYFKKIKAYFKREKLLNNYYSYKYLFFYFFKQMKRTVKYYRDIIQHPLQFPIISSITKMKNIYPLPLGIIDVGFKPENEKIYDICFIGNFTGIKRKKVINFLKSYTSKNKLKAFIGSGLSWWNYMKTLSQSKICVSIRGEGFDAYRYWEIPYAESMLLADEPIIEIPNNFVEGESAAFFKNIDELQEKLDFYLKSNRYLEIGKRGREHLLKYHTSIQRAKNVLKEIVC